MTVDKVSFSSALDKYQVVSSLPPGGLRLTGLNLFRLSDSLVVNLLLEDEKYLYPILFCKVTDASGDLTLELPSLMAVYNQREQLLRSIVEALQSHGHTLGLHSTLSIIDKGSFLADFSSRERNIYRTPYIALTDIMTQRKIYEVYTYRGRVLQGETFLDIGCGSGYGARLMARTGKKIVGIDNDPMAIEFARRLPPEEKVAFEVADIADFGESGRQFDGVILSEVLEHLETPHIFLQKALMAARPAGSVAITLPVWKYHGLDLNSDHRTNWTVIKARRFVRKYIRVYEESGLAHETDPRLYAVRPLPNIAQDPEHLLFLGLKEPSPDVCPPPLRVLLVCHALPPDEFTGTPLQTWQYATLLTRNGIKVGVLTTSSAASAKMEVEKEEREGVTIYKVPRLSWANTFLESPWITDRNLLKVYEKAFEDFKPTVVHIVDFVYMLPQVIQMASDYGAGVVKHVCNDEEICFRMSPVINEEGKICLGPETVEQCARCIFPAVSGNVEQNRVFGSRLIGALAGKLYAHREYIDYLYEHVLDKIIFSTVEFKEHFSKFVRVPPHKAMVISQGIPKPSGQTKQRSREDKKEIVFGYLGVIEFHKGVDL
ncbi:MAG: methyltransferase domain-containing protein, partial [Bacillota bacterium]|nr:methyltransferase domain-containing protein [Bacillota bacterium]